MMARIDRRGSDRRTRFLRHPESIAPIEPASLEAGCRLPLVGPRAPVQERDGRSASCSSSAMSSGRLFLDRVARQQGPSPLHRHSQANTHFSEQQAEGDISTLPAIRHFYFALTRRKWGLDPVAPGE
jgi:hypothetical protein